MRIRGSAFLLLALAACGPGARSPDTAPPIGGASAEPPALTETTPPAEPTPPTPVAELPEAPATPPVEPAPPAEPPAPPPVSWTERTATPGDPEWLANSGLSSPVVGADGTVYAVRFNKGDMMDAVMLTRDCGKEGAWTPVAAPGKERALALAVTSKGLVALGAAAWRREGETWKKVGKGLPKGVSQLVGAGDVLYTATKDQVYRSSDAGTSWKKLGKKVPGGVGTLVVAGDALFVLDRGDPGKLLAVDAKGATRVIREGVSSVVAGGPMLIIRADNAAHVSRDGGATFEPAGFEPSQLTWTGAILVGTDGSAVRASQDGMTWSDVPMNGVSESIREVVACGDELLVLGNEGYALYARPLAPDFAP